MMSQSDNSQPRNADRLHPVDPATAGPAVKLRRPYAPRLARIARWWFAGFGSGPNAGPVQTSYADWDVKTAKSSRAPRGGLKGPLGGCERLSSRRLRPSNKVVGCAQRYLSPRASLSAQTASSKARVCVSLRRSSVQMSVRRSLTVPTLMDGRPSADARPQSRLCTR
jgi:hypothetical protein